MSGADLARAEAEASEWFTRLKRTQISRDELYGFQTWRKQPENAAAFKRVEDAWKLSARLAQDPDIQAVTSKALRDHPAPAPRVSWTNLRPAILGAIAALTALTGLFWKLQIAPDYATAVGEQRRVTLSDGSHVRLNTDSALRVAFRRGERGVELLRGEAYFEVAHDAQRPFVVWAGDARVRALGTQFDVRRDAAGVHVMLVQGRVRVADEAGQAVDLRPNQKVTVTAAGPTPVRAADAATAAGWTTGRLTFRDMALRDAVAEVNRYSERKIILDAPADVADDPVTGEFYVGDTRAFVTAVSLSFDLRPEWRSATEVRLVAPGS